MKPSNALKGPCSSPGWDRKEEVQGPPVPEPETQESWFSVLCLSPSSTRGASQPSQGVGAAGAALSGGAGPAPGTSQEAGGQSARFVQGLWGLREGFGGGLSALGTCTGSWDRARSHSPALAPECWPGLLGYSYLGSPGLPGRWTDHTALRVHPLHTCTHTCKPLPCTLHTHTASQAPHMHTHVLCRDAHTCMHAQRPAHVHTNTAAPRQGCCLPAHACPALRLILTRTFKPQQSLPPLPALHTHGGRRASAWGSLVPMVAWRGLRRM